MEEFAIGGKGINVTKVLKELNVNSIAIGFISGFTGEYLKECLKKENVESYLINASGSTRINVKILSFPPDNPTATLSPAFIIPKSLIAFLAYPKMCFIYSSKITKPIPVFYSNFSVFSMDRIWK